MPPPPFGPLFKHESSNYYLFPSTYPLKSFLHAHVVFLLFTLPPSHVSFLPPIFLLPRPYRQITPSEVSFFLSDTRTALPTIAIHIPTVRGFVSHPRSSRTASLFPTVSTPSRCAAAYYCLCPRGPEHRLLSLQAVPSVVLPLTRVPFAPSLIYCITVHEVANLRRVILYKYVSQINNRAGDMSLCAVPAPRSGGGHQAMLSSLSLPRLEFTR